MGIKVIKEKKATDYTFIDDSLNLGKSPKKPALNTKKGKTECDYRLRDESMIKKLKNQKSAAAIVCKVTHPSANNHAFMGSLVTIGQLKIRCADCNCLPSECMTSLTPKGCPNCTWEECCCWAAAHPGPAF